MPDSANTEHNQPTPEQQFEIAFKQAQFKSDQLLTPVMTILGGAKNNAEGALAMLHTLQNPSAEATTTVPAKTETESSDLEAQTAFYNEIQRYENYFDSKDDSKQQYSKEDIDYALAEINDAAASEQPLTDTQELLLTSVPVDVIKKRCPRLDKNHPSVIRLKDIKHSNDDVNDAFAEAVKVYHQEISDHEKNIRIGKIVTEADINKFIATNPDYTKIPRQQVRDKLEHHGTILYLSEPIRIGDTEISWIQVTSGNLVNEANPHNAGAVDSRGKGISTDRTNIKLSLSEVAGFRIFYQEDSNVKSRKIESTNLSPYPPASDELTPQLITPVKDQIENLKGKIESETLSKEDAEKADAARNAYLDEILRYENYLSTKPGKQTKEQLDTQLQAIDNALKNGSRLTDKQEKLLSKIPASVINKRCPHLSNDNPHKSRTENLPSHPNQEVIDAFHEALSIYDQLIIERESANQEANEYIPIQPHDLITIGNDNSTGSILVLKDPITLADGSLLSEIVISNSLPIDNAKLPQNAAEARYQGGTRIPTEGKAQYDHIESFVVQDSDGKRVRISKDEIAGYKTDIAQEEAITYSPQTENVTPAQRNTNWRRRKIAELGEMEEIYPRYEPGRQTFSRTDFEPNGPLYHIQVRSNTVLDAFKSSNSIHKPIERLELIRLAREHATQVGLHESLMINLQVHRALNTSLAEAGEGLGADEFLTGLDYLEDQERQQKSQAEFQAWSRKMIGEYGSNFSRRSTPSSVERDFITGTFTPFGAEMSATGGKLDSQDKESRARVHRDLVAAQLLADFCLDTYNPMARTEEWVSKDDAGNVTGLKPEAIAWRQEYHHLLYTLLTTDPKDLPTKIPPEKRQVAIELMKDIVKFENLKPGEALQNYLGLISDDKERFVSAVSRWEELHHILPPEQKDMLAMAVKGFGLIDRRTEYPEQAILYIPRNTFHSYKLVQQAPDSQQDSETTTTEQGADNNPADSEAPDVDLTIPTPDEVDVKVLKDNEPPIDTDIKDTPKEFDTFEIKGSLVGAKSQIKGTRKKIASGNSVVEEEVAGRELTDAKAAHLGMLTLNESMKELQERPWYKTIATRVWKHSLARGLFARQAKKEAYRLMGATGIESDFPIELYNIIDTEARKRLEVLQASQNRRQRLIHRSIGWVAWDNDLTRLREEVAAEYRAKFDQDPAAADNPLSPFLIADLNALTAEADRIGENTLAETLHDQAGETRTEAGAEIPVDGEFKAFYKQQLINMTRSGRVAGELTPEIIAQAKLAEREFFFDPRFLAWYDALTPEQQQAFQLSMSTASNVIDKLAVTAREILKAKIHDDALERLDFNLSVTVGTAKVGPNEIMPDLYWGDKHKERAEIRTKLEASQQNLRQRLDLFDDASQEQGARRLAMNAYMQTVTPIALVGLAGAVPTIARAIAKNSPVAAVSGFWPAMIVASGSAAAIEWRALDRDITQLNADQALGYMRPENAKRYQAFERARVLHHKVDIVQRRLDMENILQNETLSQEQAFALLALTVDASARTGLADSFRISLWKMDQRTSDIIPQGLPDAENQMDLVRAKAKLALIAFHKSMPADQQKAFNQTMGFGVDDSIDKIFDNLVNHQQEHILNGVDLNSSIKDIFSQAGIEQSQDQSMRKTHERQIRFKLKGASGKAFKTGLAALLSAEAIKFAGSGIQTLRTGTDFHWSGPVSNWLLNQDVKNQLGAALVQGDYKSAAKIILQAPITVDMHETIGNQPLSAEGSPIHLTDAQGDSGLVDTSSNLFIEPDNSKVSILNANGHVTATFSPQNGLPVIGFKPDGSANISPDLEKWLTENHAIITESQATIDIPNTTHPLAVGNGQHVPLRSDIVWEGSGNTRNLVWNPETTNGHPVTPKTLLAGVAFHNGEPVNPNQLIQDLNKLQLTGQDIFDVKADGAKTLVSSTGRLVESQESIATLTDFSGQTHEIHAQLTDGLRLVPDAHSQNLFDIQDPDGRVLVDNLDFDADGKPIINARIQAQLTAHGIQIDSITGDTIKVDEIINQTTTPDSLGQVDTTKLQPSTFSQGSYLNNGTPGLPADSSEIQTSITPHSGTSGVSVSINHNLTQFPTAFPTANPDRVIDLVEAAKDNRLVVLAGGPNPGQQYILGYLNSNGHLNLPPGSDEAKLLASDAYRYVMVGAIRNDGSNIVDVVSSKAGEGKSILPTTESITTEVNRRLISPVFRVTKDITTPGNITIEPNLPDSVPVTQITAPEITQSPRVTRNTIPMLPIFFHTPPERPEPLSSTSPSKKNQETKPEEAIETAPAMAVNKASISPEKIDLEAMDKADKIHHLKELEQEKIQREIEDLKQNPEAFLARTRIKTNGQGVREYEQLSSEEIHSAEMKISLGTTNYQASIATRQGTRENNEDFSLVTNGEWQDEQGNMHKWSIAAVLDGVGGGSNGEKASQLAASILEDSLKHRQHLEIADGKLRYVGEVIQTTDPQQLMTVVNANVRLALLHELNEGVPATSRAATTLSGILTIDDQLYTINCGDSRTYMLKNGQLIQLTSDDSLVQRLLDADAISLEEAQNHPYKSTITKSLGGNKGDQKEPDNLYITVTPISNVDDSTSFVITTDGIPDAYQEEFVAKEKEPRHMQAQIAGAMISQTLGKNPASAFITPATQNTELDNMTAIILTPITTTNNPPSAPQNTPHSTPQPIPTASTPNQATASPNNPVNHTSAEAVLNIDVPLTIDVDDEKVDFEITEKEIHAIEMARQIHPWFVEHMIEMQDSSEIEFQDEEINIDVDNLGEDKRAIEHLGTFDYETENKYGFIGFMPEVFDQIETWRQEDTTNEIGGILLGIKDADSKTTTVTTAIQAHPVSVQPGQLDIMGDINKLIDQYNALKEEHPDLVMIGWWHTHPPENDNADAWSPTPGIADLKITEEFDRQYAPNAETLIFKSQTNGMLEAALYRWDGPNKAVVHQQGITVFGPTSNTTYWQPPAGSSKIHSLNGDVIEI